MCDRCDWVGALDAIEEISELAGRLEDETYGDRVIEKMEDLAETIEEAEHVSVKQSERILSAKLDIENRV